jgi:hypothetical protein
MGEKTPPKKLSKRIDGQGKAKPGGKTKTETSLSRDHRASKTMMMMNIKTICESYFILF